MINSDSDNSNNNDNSHESSTVASSSSLSPIDKKDSLAGESKLVLQQGGLQETISYYDRAIQQNPSSTQAYQQLLAHLKQQNIVAQTYDRLAKSLKDRGNHEEAATCYHKAAMIEAVIKEVTAKYRNSTLNSQLNFVSNVAELTDDAFSFQSAIKEQSKTNLWQIELPQNDISASTPEPTLRKLDAGKMATVEWETAQMFMQKALEFCDRKKWLEVAQACEQATSIMPEMAEAYKIWGNALQRLNRTAEAMQYYRKAVEIQPDLAEVYAGIAKLYAQQQKWQQAVEYYQKAIIIKPEFPSAYRNLANVWEQLGELEQAKVCTQRAKELESKARKAPANGENQPNQSLKKQTAPKTIYSAKTIDDSIFTCHEMAQDFEQKNLWREAAIYYRQALELDLTQQLLTCEELPQKDKEQYKVSQQSRMERIQKLLASSQNKLLQGDTSSVRDLTSVKNQAKMVKSNNQDSIDNTIRRYLRQAKLQPNSANLQIHLGDLYSKKRNWSFAIAHYSKATRINPRQAIAHMKLAKAAAKSGNNSVYIDHMYLAYTLKPSLGSAENYFILGDALKKAGNRTRAISCYEQALRIQPHFNEAYERLGKLYQETGKKKNALACYQAAVNYNPEDAYFNYSLAELQGKQGAWDDAVKAYLKVLEIQPNYPQVSQKLNHALLEKLKQDALVK